MHYAETEGTLGVTERGDPRKSSLSFSPHPGSTQRRQVRKRRAPYTLGLLQEVRRNVYTVHFKMM